jgi:hypothetical protein
MQELILHSYLIWMGSTYLYFRQPCMRDVSPIQSLQKNNMKADPWYHHSIWFIHTPKTLNWTYWTQWNFSNKKCLTRTRISIAICTHARTMNLIHLNFSGSVPYRAGNWWFFRNLTGTSMYLRLPTL